MSKNAEQLRVLVFANTNLEIIEPLHHSGLNIVGVIESRDTSIKNLLKRVLVTTNRMLKGRPTYISLKDFATVKKIPYLEYNQHSVESVARWISDLKPDLLLSHQAPILPETVFKAPKYGSINIHPTLLPKYRGSNPFFWMYYDEDMTAGVTLHWIDSGIDTGKIIEQRSITIDYGTDAEQLERRLVSELALPTVIQFLNQFASPVDATTQPENSPTPYAGRVSDEQYHAMLMDSEISIQRLWHVMHANQQWHTALLPNKPDPAFHWKLSHYIEASQPELHDQVEFKRKEILIQHSNGTIVVRREFNLNRFIVHRLLGWLK